MNGFAYFLTPFMAWLVAGCLKFLINCIRAKRLAFDLIGYGGLPSNHSAIVSSIASLIAFRDGIDTPAFGVAIALAFIVILDASSLRRQVGKHAAALNQIYRAIGLEGAILRERMGHTRLEILAGMLVGVCVGWGAAQL
jgi:acid phosphatase family membrane protein YuiD